MINDSVTAIIVSYRRKDNIPIIIDRVKKQTHKVNRIIVFHNNGVLELKNNDIDIINCSSNMYIYGAFSIAYLIKTDYIWFLDDDYPPGPEWLEYCLKKQNKYPGIYVGRGVIMIHNNKYIPNKHFESGLGNKMVRADLGGGSIIMPRKAIHSLLKEQPPSFEAGTDIFLGYSTQKYGGYKLYVPFPEREEQLPLYKKENIPQKDDGQAMWQRNKHWIIKYGMVRWAVKNGWKLLNFSEENK